jgi:DNA-binding CsgD family transcriptional regulator
VLRPSQRAFLAAAAQGAIGRIEDIVNSRRKRRRGKKVNTFDLTARELEVLQRRALLGSNAAIAKALDISIQTVDVHLSDRILIPGLGSWKKIRALRRPADRAGRHYADARADLLGVPYVTGRAYDPTGFPVVNVDFALQHCR